MGLLRVNEGQFLQCISAQQRGTNRFGELSTSQDRILNDLADVWTGTGRPRYNQAIKDLRQQTLKGHTMLQILATQTSSSREILTRMDSELAKITAGS